MTTNMTKVRLLKAIKELGEIDDGQRNAFVCAMVGHSRIQDFCFGYFTCSRCDTQVGDSLGSSYPDAAKVVVVGHYCETCRSNYGKLNWRDTLFAPDPFPVEDTATQADNQSP